MRKPCRIPRSHRAWVHETEHFIPGARSSDLQRQRTSELAGCHTGEVIPPERRTGAGSSRRRLPRTKPTRSSVCRAAESSTPLQRGAERRGRGVQMRQRPSPHQSESGGWMRVAGAVFGTTGEPGKQGAVGKQGFFVNETQTCAVADDFDAVESSARTYLSRGRRSGFQKRAVREQRQVGAGGAAACRFARTRANNSFHGQTGENESRTLRTQTATLRSFVRIVPACALSSPVPARPTLRIAATRWLANVAKSRRNWFAGRGRGPVGEQVELLFLDAVLPARAVQVGNSV